MSDTDHTRTSHPPDRPQNDGGVDETLPAGVQWVRGSEARGRAKVAWYSRKGQQPSGPRERQD